jgi:leucine dehydrogenase
MNREIFSLMENWDGEGVVMRHDRPTGTWIFIALHSSALGRPSGGTRMKVYPTLADGLEDAMRLAEGMTYKWAGLGTPFGGGKAVLAVPRPLEGAERDGLLLRYGAFVESLNGAFGTGADLGAGPDAMAIVARRTRYVLGIEADGSPRDPGPFTAHGVECGLKAALGEVFGSEDPAGRKILIQGLGDVGGPLARALARDGAELLLSDIDEARAAKLAAELGGRTVPPGQVYSTECDVYAPCAIGATVNEETIPQLKCRIVAGSANNQLRVDEDAERLHRRGIVYAPDYVINAGGALAFSLMLEGGWDDESLFRRTAGIGDAIRDILREAAASESSPLRAARARVDRMLAERRSAAGSPSPLPSPATGEGAPSLPRAAPKRDAGR